MSKLFIALFFLSTIFPLHSALSCSSGCNHGNCVTGDICACESTYFNHFASCDFKVSSLRNNQYTPAASIAPNNWIYYYVPLDDVVSDVQLNFKVQSGAAVVYPLLQAHDSYDLPTGTSNDGSLRIMGSNPLSYPITKPDVDATNGGWLTIAIHNDGTSPAQVQAQYIATISPNDSTDDGSDDSDDDNGVSSGDLMRTVIILPGLVVAILFGAGIYFTAKARRRRLMQQRIHLQRDMNDPNQNYDVVVVMNGDQIQFVAQNPQHLHNFQTHLHQLHAQHQGVPHAQPGFHPHANVAPQHLQAALLQVQQQRKYLSKEEIQKYFPKRPYSQLKSPFPQAACSICLDDFKPDTICHELYCYHIFHEACIEEWLAKHDSCPDCRKPITREAIKKFFKEKKQLKGQSVKQEEHTLPSVSNVHQ